MYFDFQAVKLFQISFVLYCEEEAYKLHKKLHKSIPAMFIIGTKSTLCVDRSSSWGCELVDLVDVCISKTSKARFVFIRMHF